MLSYSRDHADIAIVGGAAIAYNLVRSGAADVLLIDQHQTGEGTSWHTPGFMGTVRISAAGDLLSQESVTLWNQMTAHHGSDAGWYRTGGLRVARTEQRATELAAMAKQAEALGTECEVGGRELVTAAHPGFRADDVLRRVCAQ
ncbi:NAD(P)/FAD-dependent oxidoreductase (plasmid) [Mycobacterium sp. TJFP1]